MIFALVGNQNCGKTTLFNALTGSNRHVGNFPGVTVDSKIGEMKHFKEHSVVDLPGIYSIRPYSTEEIVTRDFILKNKPDCIINIVDATNIERNLYLTLQLLELQIPLVLALNMMDEVRGNGGTINIKKLSEKIGVPVIPISAVKHEGIFDLCNQVVDTAKSKRIPSRVDFCPSGPVHRCIHSVSHVIEDHAEKTGVSVRYSSIKLIEGDDIEFISKLELSKNELELIEHDIAEMEQERGLDRNAALADMRYNFITRICNETVIKCHESKEHIRSLKIDSVLTNKFLAIPIFLAIMLFVFWLTFGVIGAFLSDLLASGIEYITKIADHFLEIYQINPVVRSLVIDGIFSGVGTVLSFLPIIVVLFFFLSILEDTGYMARVAFFMDKLLRKIGLSGRSFVPMIIGFGCSVPAIMATRTLPSERDRRLTIMLTPFMSCSAKIPIYAVFCAVFFGKYSAVAMISLYLIGMLVGIVVALLLNKTTFKGKPVPFVMELPNYRFPSMKSVLLLMWEKAEDFLKRAFTIIFVSTVIIWFLSSFDAKFNFVSDSSLSLLASIGKILSPIFVPLGFGNWRAVTSLIAGFSAKEAVISTLGVLMGKSVSELTTGTALVSLFGGTISTATVSAASFLVFTLLYTPCVAAVAAIKGELSSGVKTFGIVVMQCSVAWICAFITYQIGMLVV